LTLILQVWYELVFQKLIVSHKQKTIHGLPWSFNSSFANLGVQYIVGIILARLLSPKEFGLIGMLTIFISLSISFMDLARPY
jgi:O-antigen/teichoic acid export membrane protein